MYKQHASLISFLSELHVPIPAILQVSADFVLGNAIQHCLAEERLDIDRIRKLLDTARLDGISLEGCYLGSSIRERLEIVLARWVEDPFDLTNLGALEALLLLAQYPLFKSDLWQAQNVYYEVLQAISPAQDVRLSRRWFERFQRLGDLLGVAANGITVQSAAQVPEMAAATTSDAVVMSSDRTEIKADFFPRGMLAAT